tara:strand:- start:117 stop:440 length:324 start_codon:yes stop_codon:yes gene_type:complete
MIKYLFTCFFLLITFSVSAEETELLENVPPPPSSINSDYIGEPEITIKKEGEKTVEEFRINGKLYMIKVNPDNMPSYYLYKDTSGGDWTRYNLRDPMIVPQWVILRF